TARFGSCGGAPAMPCIRPAPGTGVVASCGAALRLAAASGSAGGRTSTRRSPSASRRAEESAAGRSGITGLLKLLPFLPNMSDPPMPLCRVLLVLLQLQAVEDRLDALFLRRLQFAATGKHVRDFVEDLHDRVLRIGLGEHPAVVGGVAE